MMKGNTNASNLSDGIDDLREGTSADTVSTPDDFQAAYNYGSGKIQDYSSDNMLRRLPEPEGNATVLNTAADPGHIQALYLWEAGNAPARTRFTENMTGYRQFQQQYDVIRGMGIPTGRIVLNGWPHGFGSDGGWVTDYAAWLENVLPIWTVLLHS